MKTRPDTRVDLHPRSAVFARGGRDATGVRIADFESDYNHRGLVPPHHAARSTRHLHSTTTQRVATGGEFEVPKTLSKLEFLRRRRLQAPESRGLGRSGSNVLTIPRTPRPNSDRGYVTAVRS